MFANTKIQLLAIFVIRCRGDDESEAFYRHHGFVKLENRDDNNRTLALPFADT
jgi:hypothetical protein